jgi:hypothetical protein
MSNLVSGANRESKWTKFWRFLREFDEAIDVSEVEILQRRVGRLEKQMAELKNEEAGSATLRVAPRRRLRNCPCGHERCSSSAA